MTIDEAIKHCEEVAELSEEQAKIYDDQDEAMASYSCKECASEHRQLAEWLRELKVKRLVIDNIKTQCKTWKKNDFRNRDYGIGFISALSNIEGLIAYTEEQMEIKADENNND